MKSVHRDVSSGSTLQCSRTGTLHGRRVSGKDARATSLARRREAAELLTVQAVERSVARSHRSAPKEYLLRLHATGVDFSLADDHAEVRRGVYFPADEVIEGDLRVAASLVRLIDEGRARL